MQQLSALDSWFLHLENARMPMHIGAIYIFASDDEEQEFDFDAFKDFLRERLHLSTVFRRRLVEVPMNMGRPFWINDPDFNLDAHMFHFALPKPASRRNLIRLAAQIYNPPLDRSRPLWKMTFITGLEGIEGIPPNAFAMLAQVHHASIDGMSGAEMMAAVFDMFPKPRKIAPPDEPWKPDEIPSYKDLIAKSYMGVTDTPGKIFNFVKDAAGNAMGVAMQAATNLLPPPPMVMTAPKTILNVPVTPSKTFGAVDLSLSRIKKIKDQFKVKVNDVVLAICSSALRRYLTERDALPEKELVAMAPISVRSKDESGTMGNRISGMLVGMATNEEDPLDRLRKIHSSTLSSKMYSKATPVDQIVELIPSEVGALASRFYTQMGLSNMHKPFFNVIITNVPGPPIPLYMNGFKVLHHYGLGVTFEGIGLMIVVFSYNGILSICATSCEDIMPDVDKFALYIRDGLDELENSQSDKEAEDAYFKKLQEKYGSEE
ncbi:MAG: wax ester/triacylglycerol synthase family O-acyltransferase [Bacteroidota bacterium]